MPHLSGKGAAPGQAWDMGTRRVWKAVWGWLLVAINRRQLGDLPEASVTETL